VGPTQTEGGTIPVRDGPDQVLVVAADVLVGAEGICMNDVEPRPEDASNDDASAPGSPRGPYRD
jgi:hypothetical protein